MPKGKGTVVVALRLDPKIAKMVKSHKPQAEYVEKAIRFYEETKDHSIAFKTIQDLQLQVARLKTALQAKEMELSKKENAEPAEDDSEVGYNWYGRKVKDSDFAIDRSGKKVKIEYPAIVKEMMAGEEKEQRIKDAQIGRALEAKRKREG